ncbi:D-alanyl-D-alanine carboxypeptidase/D-alanyl-D-alanine endopeptidase [Bacteroides coprosuis]|uniref:D-alanyl-D-alanine carboxypeptidase/D-alanyl-D-alanine endopeptidase n=1 Tax=Bacteroides coprosuis TaxID=151276 RepID=UPI001DCE7AD3|nr:D-alanyl-D-alanine carboxypeptidase/D-alanyl-D-alanine-endopeptidase [Bacteroides coprosuis]HJD92748.1 D-alanyl-D-alanine carboxypeptidase/D-alanyl-D-alanine-endopeptidase [Bacteroides coprosuis]
MIIRIVLAIILAFTFEINSICQNNISTEIDKYIKQYLPSSSEVGIAVYNLSKDQLIYEHNANKLARPASTLKLLTAITALEYHVQPLETSLWYNGVIKENVLYGDLYVIGGLNPEFGEVELDEFISQIKKLSVSRIKGNIYGDISLKDSLYWGEGWAWDDNPSSYQPYISPLTYNKGKVTIESRPYNPGQKAQVIAKPKSSYYSIENKTVSKDPKAGKLEVTRNWLENQNNIMISGNVDRFRVKEVNVYNSTNFFLHTFYEKMMQNGIIIDGYYDVLEFEEGKETQLIYKNIITIPEIIKPMLKESDNLNAESLLINIGKLNKGKHISAKDGLTYVDSLVLKLGDNPCNYQIADGSGLSPYNLISANLLLNLLKYTYQKKSIFNVIYPSMPVAGIDGTLAYRMKNTSAYKKVKAKTGTITAASSLAGFTENSKGEIIAFAILNQNILKSSQARRFQDVVCSLLSK